MKLTPTMFPRSSAWCWAVGLAAVGLLFAFPPAAEAGILRVSRFEGLTVPENLGGTQTALELWQGNSAYIRVTNGVGSLDGTGLGLASSVGDRATANAAGTANFMYFTNTAVVAAFAQNLSTPTNWYVSFLCRIVTTNGMPGTGTNLARALRANSGTFANATMAIWIRNNGDNTVRLGTAVTAGTPAYSSTVVPVGSTFLVVARHNVINGADNDSVDLWVNPAASSFEAAEGSVPTPDVNNADGVEDTSNTGPGRFYIYGYGGMFDIDEFRFATTWAEVTPKFCTPPTAYAVTGGGSLCSGDPGVAVGLAGSDAGVDYRLIRNGTPTGGLLSGTGAALNFGLQTLAGTYTVQGSNTTTACVGPMTGSAVVTVLAAPGISTQPTAQTAPLGGSASFTVVATGAGLSYQWRRDGTNLSNGGPVSGATSATLTLNPVALSDAATSSDGYDVVITGTCAPPVTSTRVGLTVTVPKNLTWVGDGTANLWDTTSANWTGDATVFASNDNVTFNNSGSTAPPVDLVGVVSPNSITVNANVDYTIGTTTSGSIGGGGGLTKSGSGKLTLATVNSFTGKTTVNGGTVSVATASHLGAAPGAFTADQLTLNGGAIEYTASGSINANRGTTLGASGGTFSIPTGVFFTNSPAVTGPGSLTKTGAGSMTVAVANSYTGGTVLNAGTLAINHINALGAGPLTLAGGTLQVLASLNEVTNNIVLTADSVISGGNVEPRLSGALSGSAGTLTLSGTAATFQPRFLGAFTFGRPIVLDNANTRLRIYNIGTTQVYHGVISGPGAVHRRTATGGLQGTAILTAANTYSGGTVLTEGYLGLGSSTVGDPITSGPLGTGTLTIGDTGNSDFSIRGFFAVGGARTVANPVVFGTAALVQTNVFTGSEDLTFSGPVTLNTNRQFIVNNSGVTTFAGPIGNGATSSGLTKQGAGVLRLNGTNTYTGTTVVDGGTLAGTGILAGNLTVSSGGNLAPGAATRGTLTVNGSITLGGNFTARVSAGGSPANDAVVGATNVTYGGVLTIQNEGPALNASHSFKLFDATSYSGAFASISPATPGAGLAWNTNTLTSDGTLRISAAGGPDPTPTNIVSSVSGSTLTLSWPASHTGWQLQTQTNPVSVGLVTTSGWFTVPGSTATNQVQFTIDKLNPAVFFRLFLP